MTAGRGAPDPARVTRASLDATLWNGGYPIPALHPERRDLWLRSYVATYLERDAHQIRGGTA